MPRISTITVISLLFLTGTAAAQISPGKLTAVHSHMEGLSYCTQCHTLGNKVTNDKCLECHADLKSRIVENKGYHSSMQVRGKECVSCNSDHHGVSFQIIRFDKDKFNHNLTGYPLTGAHAKKECMDCHKPDFISSAAIRKKKFTYMGLNTSCLTCHTDYHQKTLRTTCTDCHGVESFKPAVKFNHTNTNYPLTGTHKTVSCIQCHPVTKKNEAVFQEFSGVPHDNCTNCHTDVHKGKFGQKCSECHSEVSFHVIKGISNFDHSRTNFELEGKHQTVPCASCHKNNVTNPLKYDNCTDCHDDYHHNQFVRQGVVQDCSNCHTTKGFDGTSFTLEQHNLGTFKLQGAHLATPCFTCHKKQEQWSFREIGMQCSDCHQDINLSFISPEYYPGSSCETCHNSSRWSEVTFDHTKTGFVLTGSHTLPTCRSCHFRKGIDGKEIQHFLSLSPACTQCHTDIHNRQFEQNGNTNCLRCHDTGTQSWNIEYFDHNITAFKLDGQHRSVDCAGCHKTVTEGSISYVLYKIKDSRCEHCH